MKIGFYRKIVIRQLSDLLYVFRYRTKFSGITTSFSSRLLVLVPLFSEGVELFKEVVPGVILVTHRMSAESGRLV